MTAGRRSQQSIETAQRALAQITALGLPADPPVYELFYAYAMAERADLVRAMDLALAGSFARGHADALHARFFPADSQRQRVEMTRDNIAGEVDQIVAMIEASIGASVENQAGFADAADTLSSLPVDHDSLRLIVDAMVRQAREVEHENSHLGLSLQKSHEDLASLRNDLQNVQQESLTDALTGLPNRRHFDRLLELSIDNGRREREPLCLVLIDIDNFKNFNDAHGHQTGDFVLRLFARDIRQALKGQDVVARYGGEEFAIILPQTMLKPAVIVAGALQREVADKQVLKRATNENLGRITISAGVAELRADDNMTTLIDRADACLYQAKAQGRNAVVDEIAYDRAMAEKTVKRWA